MSKLLMETVLFSNRILTDQCFRDEARICRTLTYMAYFSVFNAVKNHLVREIPIRSVRENPKELRLGR